MWYNKRKRLLYPYVHAHTLAFGSLRAVMDNASVYYDLNALVHTFTVFAPHVSGNYTITRGYCIIYLTVNI